MNSRRLAVLTLSLFAAGCTCGALDPNARFACSTDDECGPGFSCRPTADGLECVLASDAGARDAGTVDGGVDRDHDGSPIPADCDDADPSVHPGAMESCFNGLDDDCNRAIDCLDLSCDGRTCVGGGTCRGLTCRALSEVLCTDGLDNDGDGLIDCADPQCPAGATCDDANACTTGDQCGVDGGCVQLAALTCTTPPGACYSAAGVCLADAGCVYTPRSGTCDDGLFCTGNDTCSSSATCAGTPRSCAAATNVCLAPGVCNEAAKGCLYSPRASGTCDDGQNCTVNDGCDGDGGCRGTLVTCTPPTQCHVASGSCTPDGGCQFSPRVGTCDAGTGAGTCNASFTCVPPATALFPYAPSNFTEAQLAGLDGGLDLQITCNTVINTTGTPSIPVGCSTPLPPWVLVTPAGGEQTVLFLMNNFTVGFGLSLAITGNRPAIFAVLGDANIAGTVVTLAGSGTSSACGTGGLGGTGSGGGRGGGGGGGFGTSGGVGGPVGNAGAGSGAAGAVNGGPTITPLRGGCSGAAGTSALGGGSAGAGFGGGALQISVAGTLAISGTLSARGGGGGGGLNAAGSSGGGGGSGGALLLEGALLNVLGRVTANGGGGGEASGLINPGTDGTDGSDVGSQPADGGSGGAVNSGNGGAGASLLANAAAGTAGSSTDQSGGGGGGGVGRIRLNASVSCSYGASVLFSPAPTSNGACP